MKVKMYGKNRCFLNFDLLLTSRVPYLTTVKVVGTRDYLDTVVYRLTYDSFL